MEDGNKFLARDNLLKIVVSVSDGILSHDVSNRFLYSLVRPFADGGEGSAASFDHVTESSLPSSVSRVEHTVFLDDVHVLVE